MAESVALTKFACPACGGEAHWSPGRQMLVRVSCGTAFEVALPKGAPEPCGLDPALERGQQDGTRRGQRIAVKCRSCDAVSWFDRDTAADRCSFCGAAAILPLDSADEAERPQALVPFAVDEGAARGIALCWYQKQWLAPTRFRRRALTDTARGSYLPFWSFDADASARWVDDAGGGAVEQSFPRVLVCASDPSPRWLRGIEPYPPGPWTAYAPAFVAGWTVARFQLPLPSALQLAHARIEEALLQRARDAQHDSRGRKNLRLTGTRYADQAFVRTLLPVWRLTYNYLGHPYELAINGATGAAAGDAPKSLIKIALVLAVAGWLYLFVNDPEVAIKLPFWVAKGLWSLLLRPFGGS